MGVATFLSLTLPFPKRHEETDEEQKDGEEQRPPDGGGASRAPGWNSSARQGSEVKRQREQTEEGQGAPRPRRPLSPPRTSVYERQSAASRASATAARLHGTHGQPRVAGPRPRPRTEGGKRHEERSGPQAPGSRRAQKITHEGEDGEEDGSRDREEETRSETQKQTSEDHQWLRGNGERRKAEGSSMLAGEAEVGQVRTGDRNRHHS